MAQPILIATKNEGKVREFAHAFAKLGRTVVSLNEYPDFPNIVEDGDTFSANARIKAKAAGDAFHVPVLADDSGLRVKALDGAPGVYSARYSGEGATDASNNVKLLEELKRLNAPDTAEPLADGTRLLSPAQFVCVLALYDPATGEFIETEGTVDGYIAERPRGEGGFGYDPLFWLPQLNRSMAELSKEEKQGISHRGNALAKLIEKLSNK
ncbi:RdgB/HAM1 family non-canonical purine NTP pyrophosphatase [Paenibacillus sp. ATY16]|uniref:RdgB/HAM1 family non-canonical purine NTP pyrophosphatase n=1 Tax=Paenibacillus sp. ATY16 TaxID=1759312 RepID=UPI00200EEF51|nr:RdgB/HAM1 family non-canonical purine NTP pyrophosphatase [Paenibacillus sp. ATY16]MCK9861537.1 RdgB/HAM1 family non-canonical purine NTP pyrophosphatase [Paenibacillus sp. ATY16]